MRQWLVLLVLPITAAFALYLYAHQSVNPSGEPIARVLHDFTPVRVGPDESFFERDYLYINHQYPIIGQDSSGDWWQLAVDGTPGWTAASDVSVANVQNVPVIETTPCVNDMSTTCPVTQLTAKVTVQTFEHGMVLITNYTEHSTDEHWIYLLFADGSFEATYDQWNVQTLPHGTPPKGFQQTTASLDSILRTRSGLLDSLGSATAAGVTYTTTLEISDGTMWAPSDDMIYIRLPDGRAIGLMGYSTHWFFLQ